MQIHLEPWIHGVYKSRERKDSEFRIVSHELELGYVRVRSGTLFNRQLQLKILKNSSIRLSFYLTSS
jgi:hypothetical protein